MRVRAHIATSAVLAGIIYGISKSMPMAIAAFLSGILIDLDHVLEGYISFGKKFNILQTVKIAEECGFKNLYLFMHSYELLLIIALVAFLFKPHDVLVGICFGLLLHIVLDSTFNEIKPNAMFFIQRWKKGFKIHDLVYVDKQIAKAKRKTSKK